MFSEVLTTYICLIVICVTSLPYENEYGPEYGDEWILYYDDDGNTHVMNFSTMPNDTRGLIYGDAYYFLYTRRNAEPEELSVPYNDDQEFTSQYFNSSNFIKVVTHGWFSDDKTEWVQSMKNEFLINGDYNIITIDWGELSKNPNYPWAAFSTRYVGKKTAKLLDAITTSYQINDSNIHLLGHSLGSQVMAYTALFSNQRIQRITGLDPARPLFELPMMPKDCRLDKSDAEFVDIIHTGGGIFGYEKSQGHADFYPNNGRPKQPGCEGQQKVLEACSHGRAPIYFRESINSKTLFYAYLCDSWENFEDGKCKENYTYMGYPANIGDLGDYYLYTNSEPPFAQGDIFDRCSEL